MQHHQEGAAKAQDAAARLTLVTSTLTWSKSCKQYSGVSVVTSCARCWPETGVTPSSIAASPKQDAAPAKPAVLGFIDIPTIMQAGA